MNKSFNFGLRTNDSVKYTDSTCYMHDVHRSLGQCNVPYQLFTFHTHYLMIIKMNDNKTLTA